MTQNPLKVLYPIQKLLKALYQPQKPLKALYPLQTPLKALHKLSLYACLLLGLASAGVAASSFKAADAFIRGLPPGQTVTAAFLRLTNQTDLEQVLIGVDVPFAERAEIHQHSHHQGMMQMRQVKRLPIAAQGEHVFQPGGYHIMIFGLSRVLRDGETVPLILTFASGERLTVKASVRSVLNE